MDFLLSAFIGFIVFVIFYFINNSSSTPSSTPSATSTRSNRSNSIEKRRERSLETKETKKVENTNIIVNNTETLKTDDCGDEEGCCGGSCDCKSEDSSDNSNLIKKTTNNAKNYLNTIKIVYGSQTGTSKEWANKLATLAKERNYTNIEVGDLSTYDMDLLNEESLIVFIVSTYTNGKPPDNCIPFYDWLDAHSLDWRVDKFTFEKVKYAVFGIGHSVYTENFNVAAKDLDKIMNRLTAQRVVPVGLGDNGAGVEIEPTFKSWSSKLFKSLSSLNTTSTTTTDSTTTNAGVVKTSEENDEDEEDANAGAEPLVDLEDLGMMNNPNKNRVNKKIPLVKPRSRKAKLNEQKKEKEEQIKIEKQKLSKDEISNENDEDGDMNDEDEDDEDDDDEEEDVGGVPGTKEMLTPSLRKSLTKQGYKLLGTHSGVKMCRWTKAMLRGRGGCYKHTFYGIKSYQCMEMTPSLACANKCVFCWRHHKNPVGTEWKWKVDTPEFLLDEAIKNHTAMIKQMKGVPGVVKERYEEAFTIKHCALSLVGEPITYPHINQFVDLLHGKEISSFMVTNAQFPDKIDELKPVTQLYISVDAATKESLKKIDRPIFPDFWERFLACMDSLANKGQRTVYRLTLVKDWNMEETVNYAKLIKRGKPSFIEVKGVTYCGTSNASSLTMQNVPFHQEVINFASALCNTDELRDDYELAVEHEHSCAVLIAHKKFKVNGVWNTWIDYPKFHQLVKSGKEFNATDYMEPSPDWSLIGAKEKGFDPEEVRFKRNKPYQGAGCT